jgi:hypothetical protein
MRFRGWWIAPLLLFSLIGQSRSAVPQNIVVIQKVTVIDTNGGPTRPDMTITITGNRISAITATSSARIPREARVVDGTGEISDTRPVGHARSLERQGISTALHRERSNRNTDHVGLP